jgi:hypothetical protein
MLKGNCRRFKTITKVTWAICIGQTFVENVRIVIFLFRIRELINTVIFVVNVDVVFAVLICDNIQFPGAKQREQDGKKNKAM